MSTTILLFLSSCSTAIIHALIPDHWLPFAVMARAQAWSERRTMTMVAMTGAIHVLVSIALGAAMFVIGSGTTRRVAGELGGSASALGGWLLLLFGLVYGLAAHRREARAHAHRANHGTDAADAEHAPESIHAHGHLLSRWSRGTLTGGALVAIIGISPCALLQPILFAAGAEGPAAAVAAAAGFAVCTVATMVGVTWAATHGIKRLDMGFFARYGDLVSGMVIAAIGIYVILQEA